MTFKNFVEVLRRRWWYAVITIVLFGAAGFGLSELSVKQYDATSQVYFTLPSATSGNDLFNGANYAQKQLASFASLATTPTVLGPVINTLHLSQSSSALAAMISATSATDTTFVSITVADPSPTRAALIANTVADQLGVQVVKISPKTATGAASIVAQTVTPALPPTRATTPHTARNVVAGLLAGLFIGILIGLLAERLDTRVRRAADLPASVPLLGAIRKSDGLSSGASATLGPWWQGVRRLRVALRIGTGPASGYAAAGPAGEPIAGVGSAPAVRPSVLVVTTTYREARRSEVAPQLALASADAGLRVLLVDVALQGPPLAQTLGVNESPGLTDVLAGSAGIADALQPALQNVDVLVASAVHADLPDPLAGSEMRELVAWARASYDLVLLDATPSTSADAEVVAGLTDGALLVGRFGRVRRGEVSAAVRDLESSRAPVLGMVLTDAPSRSGR